MQYFSIFAIFISVNNIREIDNASLVEECRKGNREAMSLLYTRYAHKMLLLIHRYVPNHDDAQDILHDGFILAFTRLDSLKDPARFDYWLATIMRNLALKFLKSHDMEQILQDLPDTEEKNSSEEMMDFNVILSLLETLPKGYQNVFRLAVLENKSHKEISSILGIAPNSSSSQLFRAKLQLRQLITNYRNQIGLLSLLLLVSSGGILYLAYRIEKDMNSGSLAVVTYKTPETESKEPTPSVVNNQPAPSLLQKPVPTNSVATPALPSIPSEVNEEESPAIAQNQPTSDTTSEYPQETPCDSIKTKRPITPEDDYLAFTDAPLPVPSRTENQGWAFSLSLATGMGSASLASDAYAPPVDPATPPGANGGGGDNPEPPHGGVGFEPSDGNGDDDSDKEENKDKIASPTRNGNAARPLKEQAHHNHHPISFALTAQKSLNSWLGVETGLTYTYLHTTFEDYGRQTDCHWHYIGVPLKLNLTALNFGRFKVYGALSGTFYYPLYSVSSVKGYGKPIYGLSGSFSSRPVWAFGIGAGVSFSLTPQVSVYFEPTAQRYFTRKVDIPNLWSDEPWGINFPIGIRFNW